MKFELSKEELRWLSRGERGVSSEAIFSHLSGLNILEEKKYGFGDEPADPADFRRCVLLVEAVPSYRERLKDLSDRSKLWAKLVENWDKLIACFDAECPGWRRSGYNWSAPKTYDMMKQLGL